MTSREAYIAMNRMEGIGPVGARALREALGSMEAVFEADMALLMSAEGIGRETAAAIVRQREPSLWEEEMERADKEGARIVTPVDPDYPEALRDIHDPPLALYVKGTIHSCDRQALAVIGTRHPTHYGRDCARRFAGLLAQAGFTVVSGLAEGIDTCAHEGALAAKGRTWAVLGSALDCLYPPSNNDLARRIAEQGAVFSEFPFGRKPDRTTFPMRNRIVSGMVSGVLVVEAGIKSGALITARQALEQGRSVMAVPGRIDTPVAKGPHDLIRNGARLVETVDDILGEFEFLFSSTELARASVRATSRPPLNSEETAIVAALADGELGVDELLRLVGMDARSASSLLLGLEMKRLIRMLPGRRVERAGTWDDV